MTVTFDNLLTPEEKENAFAAYFLDEIKDMYNEDNGYSGDIIGDFIAEAPHGLISGGKWYAWSGDFFKVFKRYRGELLPAITAGIRAEYGAEAAEVLAAINAGDDKAEEMQDEIATVMMKFLDELCYIWAVRAAIMRGQIDDPHF